MTVLISVLVVFAIAALLSSPSFWAVIFFLVAAVLVVAAFQTASLSSVFVLIGAALVFLFLAAFPAATLAVVLVLAAASALWQHVLEPLTIEWKPLLCLVGAIALLIFDNSRENRKKVEGSSE